MNSDMSIYNEEYLVVEGTISDEKLEKHSVDPKFFKNGKLAKATLEQDTLYQGRLYKAQTELAFYDSGVLFYGTFARDEIFPLLGSLFTFLANTQVIYHSNSTVQSGTAKNVVQVGVPYNISVKPGSVSFHISGAISYCALSTGIAVSVGLSEPSIKNGSFVSFHDFDRTGRVSIAQAKINGGFKYLNFEAQLETPTSFYRGDSVKACGPLKSFKTLHATLEQGFTAAAGTQVDFYETGNLYNLVLGADITIGEMPLVTDDQVGLYETGRLRLWVPSRDVVIGGNTHSAFVPIYIDLFGNMK